MATPQNTRPVIVLVEENEENIKLMFDALAQDNTVLVADAKDDVLDNAITEQPSLIIINLTLPEMDGYELCRRLTSDGATMHIPTILLAPTIDTQVQAEGFAAGAADIVPLPLHREVVGRRVAMQLELKRCREEHEQISDLDPITGLANRLRFEAVLKHEWQRGIRTANCLSLLLFDIDEFTAYNSHYGHQAGNDCLREIARFLSKEIHRSSDRVARFDGDQFACILPDTNYPGALQLAERLRKEIDRRNIAHAASDVADHLTVSVGLASMPPAEGAYISDLFNAARRYRTEAKRYGGNRVMGARHPPLPPSEEP